MSLNTRDININSIFNEIKEEVSIFNEIKEEISMDSESKMFQPMSYTLLDVEGIDNICSKVDEEKLKLEVSKEKAFTVSGAMFLTCQEFFLELLGYLAKAREFYYYGIDNCIGEDIYVVHHHLRSKILDLYNYMVKNRIISGNKRYLGEKLNACICQFNQMTA